jgi:PAS domain S-box-containing protein
VVRPSLASQSEFHHLAEELTDVGHWHYDLVSQNLYWSAQLYRILGHTPGTFKLTPDAAIQGYTSEEKARVQDIMSAAIAGGQPFDYDVSILRPDGQVRKLHSRGRCEVDPVTGSTTAVFGVCQDITERERMREHFLRQERLVAAGTLASGVGHEINNPLSFVATNLEFALDELRSIASVHGEVAHPLEEVLLALSEAKDGAHRIRKIVRGLQSFAHHQAPTAPTSVQAAIDSGAEMAMHELRHKARLEVHTETVPQVLADEGGLTHVITNLLVNAAQAFEAHDPTTNVVELHTRLGEDGRVTISVSDNGPGIPADVFPRIFDPFFTTKPVGHGSGLGLSLCHTIVSSIGGEIRCESVVGKGTTFVILLPPAAVAARASEQPRSGTTPIARGRILLIDDEATLLRAITRLLRPTHEVNAITDPREALTLLLDPRTSYDVIFCDLMMPHVTGMDLFRIVSEQRPELAERFVFMTAGAISDATRSFLAASQNPRVDKPFSSQTLRALAQKMVNKFAVQGAERAGAGLR